MRLKYFSWRREWRYAAAAAAALLAAYWLTMPPGAVFEDAGMIAAVCRDFGVLHPSGYPLHTLLCAPFVRAAEWFSLNPARAAALFSALAAAAAAAVYYEIARRLGAARWAAALLAATLGLGGRFWAQAIIPEVYALNALLVAATLALLLRVLRAPSRRRVWALFFVGGLGLANHWPLYAANIPAFALLFAAGRPWRRIPPGRLAGGVCMAVLGLAPYLYLFLRPHFGAPLSVFSPPQTWAETLAYIAREPYAREIPLAVKEWARCGESALRGAGLLAAEYTAAGAVAAVWGAAHFFRRRPLLWSIAAVWGVAATAPLLAGYLCGDSRGGTAATVFAAYPLPAMIFVMLFVAEGAARLPKKMQVMAAAGLLAATAATNYPQNNRADDRFAETYAAAVLASLPPDAAIVLDSDFNFPVFYRLHALSERRDILVVKTMEELAKHPGRRFFTPHTHPPAGAAARDWGILLELSPAGAAPPPPPLLAFYRGVLKNYAEFDSPFRQWDNIAARRAVFDGARALAAAKQPLPPEWEELRAALNKTPEGLFGSLTARMKSGEATAAEIRDTLAILRRADGFLAAWRAQILHREGILAALAGRRGRARAAWREALDLDLSADNPALVDLLHSYAAEKNWEDYRKLRRRYWMADNPALSVSDSDCAEFFGGACRAKSGS